MKDWDDLRFLLALYRKRTLAAAGRRLKVDPTTVGRRLTALEETLGVRLMLRTPEGYRPTEAGMGVIARAEQVEQHIQALDRETQADRPTGLVRLTTIESVASGFIAPSLMRLRRAYPDLVLELLVTNLRLDLARGAADIALRLSRPTEVSLVARRLVTLRLGVYASKEYLADIPADRLASSRGKGAHLVLYAEPMGPVPETRWLEQHYHHAGVALRATSVEAVRVAIAAGAGIGVLPERVGRRSGLVRLDDADATLQRDLWLVVHPDLARTARIRAVIDFVEECLALDE